MSVAGEDEDDDDDDGPDDNDTKASGFSSGVRSRRRSMMAINPFLHDDPSEMTYQRRLALYLMKKKWYNPQYDPESEERNLRKSKRFLMDFDDEEDDEDDVLAGYEKPSLAKAWAYFEHSTLQRHVIDAGNEDEPRGLIRRLYSGYIKADRVLPRAEPGTTSRKTRLYDPISTPHKQVSFG